MTISGTFPLQVAMEPSTDLDTLMERAWAVRAQHHAAEMLLVRPTATATVSVTGTQCALRCAHCNGRYLEHMQPVWDVDLAHAKSCLISGGCDSRGSVPVLAHASSIAEIGRNHRINMHVGLADARQLAALRLPIDVLSFDLVGDTDTTHEVYGIDVSLEHYVAQMLALEAIAPVVPHITIGLHAGAIRGEYAAIQALRALKPKRLVFLVLIPTAGTRYAACAPPDLDQVGRVLAYARCVLPAATIYLGCMRPHGRYRQQLDELAVRAGVNGIVNPTRAGERALEAAGLAAVLGDECCALY